MEPVTYFVTYGTAMACYAYFVLTKQVSIILMILTDDCLTALFAGIYSPRCQRPPTFDHITQNSEKART